MDNGLRRVQGRKVPTKTLDVDLIDFARALTSVLRGHARATLFRNGDQNFVRVTGQGLEAVIPKADWEKVMPLIESNTFSTLAFPVESAVRPLDVTRFSVSTVDARDPLYGRVFGALGLLFPDKVPT